MIRIYDRKKNEFFEEKVAAGGVLGFLYGTLPGRVLTEGLIKRYGIQKVIGFLADRRISRGKIASFVKEHGIDMSESQKSIEEFTSFNDFFTRRLKAGSRDFLRYEELEELEAKNGVKNENELLISPGDGRLSLTEVHKDMLIVVKGLSYRMGDLMGGIDADIMLTLRLNPTDYHRFHYPLSGRKGSTRSVKGYYYSVNPVSLEAHPEVFFVNRKESFLMESERLGECLMVMVGATAVGSIIVNHPHERQVVIGEEAGYFKFGGSTILLFLSSSRTRLDEDLLTPLKKGYEVKVLMGEVLGKAVSQE